jgi:prophage antirepressor-like protein
MSKIQLIRHPEFGEVRTVTDKKGKVLFCLSDVCEVLGIENSRNVKNRLNIPHVVLMDIGVVTGKKADGSDAKQIVQMIFIDEPNLYRCIFKSRKPEAIKFQDWVFEEVLPSIRRQGYYVHPSYMDKKEIRRIERNMSNELSAYIYEEDIVKTSKKIGVSKEFVRIVMKGETENNAVMQELQRRAIINRKNEINAYAIERMVEVINKLKGIKN